MLRPTRDTRGSGRAFGYGAVTRCGPAFQLCPPSLSGTVSESRNPGQQASRFGLLRFRSPLLAQCRLISSPSGTEMFHFPECRFAGLWIRPAMAADEGGRVAPFGNPRIKAR